MAKKGQPDGQSPATAQAVVPAAARPKSRPPAQMTLKSYVPFNPFLIRLKYLGEQ